MGGPETGTPAPSRRFPKDRRVRRRAEFQVVFERGTRFHGRFFTLILLPNRLSSSRLGIVASRKLGGAVERNRAKRLIREMFRQHGAARHGFGLDAVVIPRRELLGAPFSDITQDFTSLWRRGSDRMAAHARA
jgi:ribonuclease P protein component